MSAPAVASSARTFGASSWRELLQVRAAGDLAAALVDHPERDGQVLGQPVELPGVARDRDAAHPAQLALQPVEQRLVARPVSRASTARAWSGAGANSRRSVLGQRLDQRRDQLLAQPGHLPGERRGVDLVQRGDRHVDGDPVGLAARLERVRQRQREPAGLDVRPGTPTGRSRRPAAVRTISSVKSSRSGCRRRSASTRCRSAARRRRRRARARRRRRRASPRRRRGRAAAPGSPAPRRRRAGRGSRRRSAWRVSQSPSTSACRMNSSRACSGSIRPRSTVRPTTIGTPCSVTRSTATAPARLRDQCGSEYVRLTRCPASGSIHSGWIFATVRAHSREVSTSSAAITQRGGFFASGEPGKIMNLAPRAPRNSRVSASRRPTWLSRPDSTATWIRSGSRRDVVRASCPRCGRPGAAGACRSCHSRMRRKCRNSSRSSLRNRLPVSASRCSCDVLPQVEEARGSPSRPCDRSGRASRRRPGAARPGARAGPAPTARRR